MAQNWFFVAAGTPATGANPVVGVPTGYSANDKLIIVAVNNSNTGTTPFTTPSGWTSAAPSGSSRNLSIYYKTATASESSVTVTCSDSTSSAVMLCYSSVSSIDVVGTVNAQTTVSTLSTNSLTTTTADDLVISIFTKPIGSQTWTSGSVTGTTQRVLFNSTSGGAGYCGFLICDENQSSAGATTVRSATLSASTGSANSVGISFKQTISATTSNFFAMF